MENNQFTKDEELSDEKFTKWFNSRNKTQWVRIVL